ncbi:hypothetical protein FLACOL_01097 [Flavobacterium columnare]|uniref:Uncharacterized protein n=2 Tax=Flavobacterium TaxID=237 RepID=A0ABW8PLD3_9FLAO|nr:MULTISPECIES: hypothetical protein [Flavobacterium]SPE77107.1 hypothetical protein FLACOL_01097 [Flavobacterium columnare]
MDINDLKKIVEDLNQWLLNPANKNHADYRLKEHDRNYYVSKIIEIEELQLNTEEDE